MSATMYYLNRQQRHSWLRETLSNFLSVLAVFLLFRHFSKNVQTLTHTYQYVQWLECWTRTERPRLIFPIRETASNHPECNDDDNSTLFLNTHSTKPNPGFAILGQPPLLNLLYSMGSTCKGNWQKNYMFFMQKSTPCHKI